MAADELIVAEPRAPYAGRLPLVADCSIIAALVFDEAESAAARDILSGHEILVPNLIDHEIANVAVKKSRNGLDEIARQGLAEYTDMSLTRYEVDAIEQWQFAIRHDLSAYDAAYLWLAEALGAPLATFDRKLGHAARMRWRASSARR